jgi:motility quorum-sensing regulator/GCU-specific mRNA interferase toxin
MVSPVEKRKATYSLDSIKAEFCGVEGLRMTKTAQDSSMELGLLLADIVALVQAIVPSNLYKSMTSNHDHKIWQDVYHVPWQGLTLYVKFTVDDTGHLILSLKEK